MATRKHLVVVLPGIGGSVLHHLDGAVAWDAGFGSIVGFARCSDRLSLAESPRLRPVGLIRSRRLLPGWTVVHGYEGLIQQLKKLPGANVAPGDPTDPVPGANVVLFPYDFRRSLAEAAEQLDDEVKGRLKYFGGAPAQKVIVVAHSMGGLVAAYWLGVLEGWRVCRALITLGTPFRGAPKALKIMVNGVLGGRLSDAVDVLRGWPGMAELLPRYPAVWDVAAQTARYPHELPIAWLQQPAEDAYQVHQTIEDRLRAIPRGLPEFDARIGWSHPTLRSARWQDGVLTVDKTPATWLGLTGWDDDRGDGTVPAFAAVPVEQSGHSPEVGRVRQRHAHLGSARFVADLIEAYERYADLGHVRDPDSRPVAIGLDLESEYDAGTPVEVRATIEGAPAGPSGMTVVLRTPGSVRPVQQLRLEPIDGQFVGEFAGPPPGMYDVQVDAPSVPGVGDLRVIESVAAIG